MGLPDMELEEAFALLRLKVDVRDRAYKGKSYPLCFVGTEATDVLAEASLGRTRETAVQVLWTADCFDATKRKLPS